LISAADVQRNSYIESPPQSEEASLSSDGGVSPPQLLINRKASAVLPRPTQRSDSIVSVAASDDLSPFGWYVNSLLVLISTA